MGDFGWRRAMIAFIHAHPYLFITAVVYLTVAGLGWMFIAGASIASGRCDPPPNAGDASDDGSDGK